MIVLMNKSQKKGGGTKKLPKDQLLRSHRCPPWLCPRPRRPCRPPGPSAQLRGRTADTGATLPVVLIYWESRRRSAQRPRGCRAETPAGRPAPQHTLRPFPVLRSRGPTTAQGQGQERPTSNNGSQKVLLKTVGVPQPGRCLTRHGHQAVPLVQLVPPPGTWRL